MSITIRSSTISFEWADTKVNIIDTLGHMDFIAEVERSPCVLDGAILVISAKEGIQYKPGLYFKPCRS
nr:GTP-binding protein [Desulfosporosinus sp. OT]